jgi:phosphatidylinositol alpha-1,6-mannosyltransferase
VRRHLLITNDFPPKIGGIQSYLWELWRRLPSGSASVYTTPYAGTAAFDAQQPFPVERSPEPVLIPYPWLISRVHRLVEETGSDFVVLDPAVPLGAIGPRLQVPYGLVLHGAEVTIPARLPGLRSVMAATLDSASLIVSAGHYALAEAERCVGRPLPSVVVPPGVDTERFVPLEAGSLRDHRRARFDVGPHDILLATVNRLVPRKGMATLVRAAAEIDRRHRAGRCPRLRVVIGGSGRQQKELQALIDQLRAPVRLLGRISDPEVVGLYQAADLMAMLCSRRWWGLEQEGFGIVFLEAAAAGIPQIAGRSGGAHEAVEDDVTGLVIDDGADVDQAVTAIEALMVDRERRLAMGKAARQRVESDFTYDHLAIRLHQGFQAFTLSVPGS